MPNVEHLLRVLQPHVSDVAEVERVIRLEFSGQRIHVPVLDSRKRPGLVREIERLSARLPTGVVAERLHCSPAYVRQIVRTRAKTDGADGAA